MLLANTLQGLRKTLEHLHNKRSCPQLALKTGLSGQQSIRAFPLGWGDSFNFSAMQGLSIELFLQAGQPATLCSSYQGGGRRGQVAVVVGAGHQGYVSIAEVLYYMFNHNCTVLLKYHPLQATYAEHAEQVCDMWGGVKGVCFGGCVFEGVVVVLVWMYYDERGVAMKTHLQCINTCTHVYMYMPSIYYKYTHTAYTTHTCCIYYKYTHTA